MMTMCLASPRRHPHLQVVTELRGRSAKSPLESPFAGVADGARNARPMEN
jgi:hypothetical protein